RLRHFQFDWLKCLRYDELRHHISQRKVITLSKSLSILHEPLLLLHALLELRLRLREEVDRKSTRLNSSHVKTSYAVFCLKKTIRPLKRYVSWVQNVVRQFGPYPVWALEH